MTIYVEIELRCDGTEGPYDCDPPVYGNTVKQARRTAKESGWLVGQPGGKDYCARPDHRPLPAVDHSDGPGWREARRDDSWFRILP